MPPICKQLQPERMVLALIIACVALRAPFDSPLFVFIDVAIGAASIFLCCSLRVAQPKTVSREDTSFLSVMSHDLRTPLNGILASAKLMQDLDLPRNNAEALDIIVRCSKHLDARISDLIDYSALEQDTLVARPSTIPIYDLLSSVSRLTAADAFDMQLGFSLDIKKSVPEMMTVDPDRLYRILDHMLRSVMQSMTRGSIVFSVYLESTEANDSKLCFQVQGLLHSSEGMNIQSRSNAAISQAEKGPFEVEFDVSSRLTNKLVAVIDGQLSIAQFPCLGSTLKLPLAMKEANTPLSIPPLDHVAHVTIFSDDRLMCDLISEVADDLGFATVASLPICSFTQELSTIPTSHVVFLDCPATAPSIIIELGKISIPETVRVIPIIPCNNVGALQELYSWGFTNCLVKPFLRSDVTRLLGSNKPEIRSPHKSQLSLKVLVVDDVRINQVVLSKHLELAGHTVVTASNGQEAIDLLEQTEHFTPTPLNAGDRFDAIIMDIDMPVLSGLDATKIIRSKEEGLGEKGFNSHIPIVGVTADVIAHDQQHFLLAGMEWCLTKPIEPRRLLQLIEHFGRLSLRKSVSQVAPDGSIDLSWLRSQFDNDEQIVGEILDAFLEEIDSLWLSLFRLVLTRDAEAVRKSAHAIKGSLQNVGARAAAESARAIELAAKQGMLGALDSLIENLAEEVKAAKECAQGLGLSRVGRSESDSSHLNLTAAIETKG